MPGRRSLRLLGAVLAVLLTACGSGDDDEADGVAIGVPLTPSTTVAAPAGDAPPTTPAAPTTTATGGTVAGDFSLTPVSLPAAGETALLTAVRAAGHDGFDRVVFEFVAGLPGYEVGYVERPVRQDGSGDEVEVTGQAVLEVRMSPASGAEVSASGVRTTYTGPDRLRPRDGSVVTEAVRVGDFEAQLTWVVGTSARAPFKVTTLGSPARLVVDVRRG